MRISAIFLIPLIFSNVLLAEEKKDEEPGSLHRLKQAAFCIAYELRDAERKKIQVATIEPDDPFESRFPDNRIIIDRRHLNIAGLTSWTKSQKLLSLDQLKELTKATFEAKVYHPPMDCYAPHHAFIFYDITGIPVACIEVCFTCNAVKVAENLFDPKPWPKDKNQEQERDPFARDSGIDDSRSWQAYSRSSVDFLTIAKLCQKLEMGLGPYKSIEEFKKTNTPKKPKITKD